MIRNKKGLYLQNCSVLFYSQSQFKISTSGWAGIQSNQCLVFEYLETFLYLSPFWSNHSENQHKSRHLFGINSAQEYRLMVIQFGNRSKEKTRSIFCSVFKVVQVVLRLHGSLTTLFSKYVIRFILVLSYVHLALNHSSTYTMFCLHGCFSKISKNSIRRGPPVNMY